MKRNCRTTEGAVYHLHSAIIALSLIAFVRPVAAEEAQDPNAALAFRRIYVAAPRDNVDGAYKAPVDSALTEFFQVNPRFTRVDNRANADGVVELELHQGAQATEVEGRLVIGSTGEVFAQEKARADVRNDDKDLRAKVLGLLKAIMGRIPFFGSVSGRDGDVVTLDIGGYHGIAEGDLVQIARVDAVKRHPLLKQIVDVQMVPVGSVRVTEAEEGISFAKVEHEFTGEKVMRLHKVTSVKHAPPPAPPVEHREDGYVKRGALFGREEQYPEYGYVSLGVDLAFFAFTGTLNSTTKSGGGFSPGFALSGEVWFTSNIFIEPYAGVSLMSYNPDPIGGVSTGSKQNTTRTLGLNAGYRFLFDGTIYGPQLSVRGGYYNFRWQSPTVADDFLTSRSYSGINVALAGAMPFGRRPFGLLLDMGLLLFPSYTEATQVVGKEGSSMVARFYIGGYYFFTPGISFRAGLNFETWSTDFDSTTAPGSVNQKNIGFLPSVQYYF